MTGRQNASCAASKQKARVGSVAYQQRSSMNTEEKDETIHGLRNELRKGTQHIKRLKARIKEKTIAACDLGNNANVMELIGKAMTYVKKLQDKSISQYLDLEIMILIKTGKLEEAVQAKINTRDEVQATIDGLNLTLATNSVANFDAETYQFSSLEQK